MQFTSLADFIAMDGHGFYVWLSYGAGALLFLILISIGKSENRQIKTKIIQREQRNTKLKAAAKLKQLEQDSKDVAVDNTTQEVSNISAEPVIENNNAPSS